MPLGQGIGEWWNAVRDRVELSGDGPTWEITAGSFESALAYAHERFESPVVLARKDRDRWWPRVTLTVTTEPSLAASAPAVEDLRHPVVPPQATQADAVDDADLSGGQDAYPSSLEAIFAHQEELRIARQRQGGDAESHAQGA